jgi:hypothetical protein
MLNELFKKAGSTKSGKVGITDNLVALPDYYSIIYQNTVTLEECSCEKGGDEDGNG